MNSRKFLLAGTLFAALSVIIGAFAAHSLKPYFDDAPRSLEDLQIGVRYQMYHALALILTGILMKQFSFGKLAKIAGWLFIVGIIFFSGSLYILSLQGYLGIGLYEWFYFITPLGGLCFISGWIFLFIAVFRCKNLNSTENHN